MELRKWKFDSDVYDTDYYVVFAENLEEALAIVNEEQWLGDEEDYLKLEDYAIEELKIKNPEKAYKGCYFYDRWY